MIRTLKRKSFIISILLLIATVVSASAAYYFYQENQQAKRLVSDPDAVAREEMKNVVERIGTFIELPRDEEPTLATVSDKEKLQEQPFFARAENGDKVLIYTQAKKAILYRPSTNKIIEVAPINIGASEPVATSTSPTPSLTPLRLALYNGTTVSDLTKKMEEDLKELIPSSTVVARENAQNNDYVTTLVIDVTGTRNSEAEQIATLVGGTVQELPADEKNPTDVDIIVIIGQPVAIVSPSTSS